MKKYLVLIAFAISFFNLTQAMEEQNRNIHSFNDNASHLSINIETYKEAILGIFRSQPRPEGLVGLFSNLVNIFTKSDFNSINSTPLRLELIEFIKNQCKHFFEFDNREPEILTQELQTLIKKGYKRENLLDDDETLDKILYLIMSGANSNVKITINDCGEIKEFPLLNFLIRSLYCYDHSEDENCPSALKDLIFCLLIHEADVNYCTTEIESPLLQASSYEKSLAEIMRVLIVFGANVNQIGSFGNTVINRFFV